MARRVWEFDDAALGRGYRETGDLGSALGPLLRAPRDAQLFRDRLTPSALDVLFGEIAEASGKRAGKRREAVLERILRACDDPLEATYVVKIVTGDLRVGLREGLVLDAIARAFDADPAAVRRGAMAAGDVGAVALAAKHGTLAELRVEYGAPIGFMLATPVPYGDAYAELDGAQWIVEDKYDGIRAQAHVRDGEVRLFSRRLNDVTASYPEVAAALRRRFRRRDPRRRDRGRARRPRAAVSHAAGAAAAQDRSTRTCSATFRSHTSRSTCWRRAASCCSTSRSPCGANASPICSRPARILMHAPFESAGELPAAGVNERFEAARARGNEGLMLKRARLALRARPPRKVVAQAQARALDARRRGGRRGVGKR